MSRDNYIKIMWNFQLYENIVKFSTYENIETFSTFKLLFPSEGVAMSAKPE